MSSVKEGGRVEVEAEVDAAYDIRRPPVLGPPVMSCCSAVLFS